MGEVSPQTFLEATLEKHMMKNHTPHIRSCQACIFKRPCGTRKYDSKKVAGREETPSP